MWTYEVVDIDSHVMSREKLKEVLNMMGEDRWEFVNMIPIEGFWLLTFKRRA
jgi:hypothetical protein